VTADSIAAVVSRYGLLAVFGGSLIEGEGILILAAALAGQGALDPVRVWLVAAAGAWLGHLFWFTVGRAIRGRRLSPGSPSFKARVAQVTQLVAVRPVTTIFLLQYLYGLRLVGAVALGLADLSFVRFASYQIVNCLLWAAGVGGAAYLLGGLASEIFHGWFKWVWIGASVGLVVVLLRFFDRLVDRIKT
jgi:membrane-associated protein